MAPHKKMKTALVQALRLQGFRPPGKFNKARHGLRERRAKSRRSSIFTYNSLSFTLLDTRLQCTRLLLISLTRLMDGELLGL